MMQNKRLKKDNSISIRYKYLIEDTIFFPDTHIFKKIHFNSFCFVQNGFVSDRCQSYELSLSLLRLCRKDIDYERDAKS